MTQFGQRFTNKVIWVSGAAQGIGRGIAEYFADEGAKVALIDIKEEAGQNWLRQFGIREVKQNLFYVTLEVKRQLKAQFSRLWTTLVIYIY